MEKIFDVLVRLPAANREYNVRIPAGMNACVAAYLTGKALDELSDGCFCHAKTCVLAWQEDGRQLDPLKTVAANGVLNGSKLLLV